MDLAAGPKTSHPSTRAWRRAPILAPGSVSLLLVFSCLAPGPSLLAVQAGPSAPAPRVTGAGETAATASEALSDGYILGAGDQLEISFLSPAYTSLGGRFSLLSDGSASLPMLGSVVLDGLTLNQASRWLTSLYRPYLRRPELNLRVAVPRPMQVSVVGEVENPGLYLLSPTGEASQVEGQQGSVPGLPTVVSLIQKAGGITLNANLSDVRLRRRIPGDSNQLREVELNLVALLQQGDKRQNPFLFDGDTLLISRAPAPPPDEVLELAATNLSPQSIQVNVVGEVKSPGRINLRAGTPLIQGILAAGGPNQLRANRGNVELVRINRNGTATLRRYALDLSQGVSGPRNPPLRDGDSVIVNRSVLATGADAITAVTSPLTGLVNVLALVRILQDLNDNNNNNNT
jgi:polysaccharide export outer membrane protein